jgi:YD repeat-containing protein
MVRTPWSRLASRAFFSWVARLRTRNALRTGRRPRRDGRGGLPVFFWPAEVLEARVLLFATAVNDSYTVTHDHTLSPNAATGVIANDMIMGGSVTAVLVAGPSHGSLTLNADGSFTYLPTTHYVGSDSFTYLDHDSFDNSNSNTAMVSLTIANAAPVAVADSYLVYKDSFNSASEGAAGVLANDSDPDGDSLTASLVTGPSHGTLTLNSNGSFVYTPVQGYYGPDSFTYAASDGVTTTNATASLTVTNPFDAQTNSPDQPWAGVVSQGPFSASQLTGELQTALSLGQGRALVYSSLTADVEPVVIVESTFSSGTSSIPSPDSVEVRLTFGGLNATTIFFNGSLMPGDRVHFADQIDAGSLPTGHYQYSMTVISHYGTTTATRVFTGYQDIVNRQASEFGAGWSLAELDRLGIGTGGVLWVGGKTGTAWFSDTGNGTYSSPAGPMAFTTLVKNPDGTYTLTDKFGNAENFSSTGLLASKVDTNGNTTTYAYASGKISIITDPFGRTATFNYTAGLVTSITDIAGRTTTLAHTGGQLTSITAPDPDGAGPLAAPLTSYAYDSSNRLTGITDPLSNVTTLSYSFSGRLSQATFPDTNTAQFTPFETLGLVDTGAGFGTQSNPASIYKPSVIASTFIDSLSHATSLQLDRFGGTLSETDPLGYVTSYVRDANGVVTRLTQPDPDGGGPLAAPITAYQYDSKGNLTRLTYADTSYETWTYDATLNKPLTHTDQLGHTTTYTYDTHGNLLTATDPLGNVTTYTYTSRGQVATITAPNPSTGGSTGGPVTSFTYDADGRVTRITNPDGTHKDFTYDSANNLLTATDELGRVTTYSYDNLNRLTYVTLPDPDGAGPLTSPVTICAYDSLSRLSTVTDALGNVTSYAYNSRGWLTGVTAPNPATGGSSGGLITTYAYNANGWLTSQTDPLGNVTSFAYDNVTVL